MQIFNWEKFKQGKIVVTCLEKSEAIDFISQCEKQGYVWRCNNSKVNGKSPGWRYDWSKTRYITDKDGKIIITDEIILECEGIIWGKNRFESVKEKYSFAEVLANKKPYQTWIGEKYIVKVDGKSDIEISYKDSSKIEPIQNINIDTTSKVYTLQEIQISFDEAVAICGKDDKKTMKSVITKNIYAIRNMEFSQYNRYTKGWDGISASLKEIKGEWIVEPILWIE